MNQQQNADVYDGVDIRHIASEGNRIYESIKEQYGEEKGKFLAIDIESGDAFLGDSNSESVEHAKSKYPDHIFYVVKVGYSAVETLASMKIRA